MKCGQDCTCIYNKTFDRKTAEKDLKSFHKKGASKSTGKLIECISKELNNKKSGLNSLLDIGGGIGAIGIELSAKGISSVTSVDVSTEYLAVSEKEVKKREIYKMFTFIQGDAVEKSNDIPKAGIVTLDKSICCYKNYTALLKTSLEKAEYIYGIVIPRDVWWVKTVNKLGNFIRRVTGNPFRSFIHPINKIKEIILKCGFEEIYSETAMEWQVLVFKNSKFSFNINQL